MPQLIHSIRIQRLLGFDETGIDLPLRPLNVLIGPNGSGKSNLIEVISLLASAPKEIAGTIRDGGGVADWLWKGTRNPVAHIDAVVDNPDGNMSLRYVIDFAERSQRFELVDEKIENEAPHPGQRET